MNGRVWDVWCGVWSVECGVWCEECVRVRVRGACFLPRPSPCVQFRELVKVYETPFVNISIPEALVHLLLRRALHVVLLAQFSDQLLELFQVDLPALRMVIGNRSFMGCSKWDKVGDSGSWI